MTTTLPIENGNQFGILVTSTFSIFIATISVVLRFIAKNIGSRIDYSDYCTLAAMIWNTALHTCCMLLVAHGGFGFHTMDIYQRFGPETATFFFKVSFALLWNITVCFSKLSVLLMYTALIPTPSMIKWARSIGTLIVAWNVADIIAGFLICRPIAKNWDFTIAETCGSQPKFYFAMGMVNLITDAVVIVLMMSYLYRLRLAMRKKLLAMGLLSIGIGTPKNAGSSYEYGSSKQSGLYSKKGSRSASRGPGTLTELVDDNDDSSEVQLQPMKPVQNVNITAAQVDRNSQALSSQNQAITVERKWEIRRD
ncbi:Nn.00g097180.m01.CDS01 [Neocucurbitaria sp. VM-36]